MTEGQNHIDRACDVGLRCLAFVAAWCSGYDFATGSPFLAVLMVGLLLIAWWSAA